VIFGVTEISRLGSSSGIVEPLYEKLLPQRFAVHRFFARAISREEFRGSHPLASHIKPGQFKEEDLKHFLDHMSYEQGLFDEAACIRSFWRRAQEHRGTGGSVRK